MGWTSLCLWQAYMLRTWISPLDDQLEKTKLNKGRRRHPQFSGRPGSKHQRLKGLTKWPHIMTVLMKPIQENVNVLTVLYVVNDKSSLHMFSTDAILLFKHFSSARFNQKTWNPWIHRAVHPHLPTRQSDEQTAACAPRTRHCSHKQTFLLVWVIVCNTTDPQGQSHRPRSLLVLLERKGPQARELLSPKISSTIYQDSLKQFLSATNKFYKWFLQSTHPRSLPHTQAMQVQLNSSFPYLGKYQIS